MLLPVGLVYAGLYYSLFRVFIRVLNLKTPGREDDPVETVTHVTSGGRGEAFILALGGAANLVAVASCTTRLRLRIVSRDRVDEAALKRLGARGVIAPSPDSLQVVIGPTVEAVAQDIRDQWTAAPSAIAAAIPVESAPTVLSDTLKAALGGAANIRSSTTKAGRLCVVLADAAALNETALTAAAPKGFVRLGSDSVQVLV